MEILESKKDNKVRINVDLGNDQKEFFESRKSNISSKIRDILGNVMALSGNNTEIAGRMIHETSSGDETAQNRILEGTNITILSSQKKFLDNCNVKRRLSLYLRKELDNYIGVVQNSESIRQQAPTLRS